MIQSNSNPETVAGFGDLWSRFGQSSVPESELREIFDGHCRLFPWDPLAPQSEGMDVGRRPERWANRVARRSGLLHCIDTSEAALRVAQSTLDGHENCRFHQAWVADIPIPDAPLDFGYSLGVPSPARHHCRNSKLRFRAEAWVHASGYQSLCRQVLLEKRS